MANEYGVANPVPIPIIAQTIGAADVACAAGVETNCFQATLAGLDASGFYYPRVDGQFVISIGATPPTSVGLAIRIGSGADIVAFNISNLLNVANANIYQPIHLVGVAAQAPWQGAGSVLNLTVNPVGQAVTVRQAGARVLIALVRAPDQ